MYILKRVSCHSRNTIFDTIKYVFRGQLSVKNHVNESMKVRCLCHGKKEDTTDQPSKSTENEGLASFSTLEKYKIFKDEDSPVILDVLEERFKALELDTETVNEYEGLNLKRGKRGVYDIEDIVELLRREKGQNIFVIKIPQEFSYVDYIVIVTGKSVKHMKSLAEFTRKVYKKKRQNGDCIPKIEGEDSRDWIAMDLGNIALHIFSEEARLTYDLEALWSLGAKFDELSQMPEDPLVELLQKHSVYLGDLQPASSHER